MLPGDLVDRQLTEADAAELVEKARRVPSARIVGGLLLSARSDRSQEGMSTSSAPHLGTFDSRIGTESLVD